MVDGGCSVFFLPSTLLYRKGPFEGFLTANSGLSNDVDDDDDDVHGVCAVFFPAAPHTSVKKGGSRPKSRERKRHLFTVLTSSSNVHLDVNNFGPHLE